MRIRASMGKAEASALRARECLRLGGSVMTMKCGLAYAGHSILKGDAQGIVSGLDTAARSAKDVEDLLRSGRGIARSIKTGTNGLLKELKPGKTISRKTAGKMLEKVRRLAVKVDKLNQESSKSCPSK